MSDVKTPSNPSRRATARVKNPLPVPTVCNICGEEAVRESSHMEIYGKVYSDWPYNYLCECCGAYVGMHPFTNIPLGTLADKELRELRKISKYFFNQIWQEECLLSRSDAYAELAKRMGIPAEQCHFGWFNKEQCYKAREVCDAYLAEHYWD